MLYTEKELEDEMKIFNFPLGEGVEELINENRPHDAYVKMCSLYPKASVKRFMEHNPHPTLDFSAIPSWVGMAIMLGEDYLARRDNKASDYEKMRLEARNSESSSFRWAVEEYLNGKKEGRWN